MTVHLVTFATPDMGRSRDLCIESAIRNGIEGGNVDPWSDGDLVDLPDDAFYITRPDDPRRALGWWSWKPAIIDRNLNGSWCKDGDILIYADAGVEFIAPVSHIIERMDQDIFLFGNNWEHAHWCKRDIVDEVWLKDTASSLADAMDYHSTWDRFGKQVQASVIFFRVSDYTRQFVAEWLKWCLFEGGRLIDDSPSRAPNHPEFRENRHDQAILTTMAYREGLRLHAWPAVYNRFLGQEFVYSREGYPESDNYPALFHHHRFRNSDFEVNKNGSMDT